MEKWQLGIQLWLACVRILCDSEKHDGFGSLNESLIQLLTAAVGVMDREELDELCVKSPNMMEFSTCAVEAFCDEIPTRQSRLMQLFNAKLPGLSEPIKNWFFSRIQTIFEASSRSIPVPQGDSSDVVTAIGEILQNLEILWQWVDAHPSRHLYAHVGECVGFEPPKDSPYMFVYTFCIYARMACEFNLCPHKIDVLVLLFDIAEAKDLTEIDFIWKTIPGPLKSGIIHKAFVPIGISILHNSVRDSLPVEEMLDTLRLFARACEDAFIPINRNVTGCVLGKLKILLNSFQFKPPAMSSTVPQQPPPTIIVFLNVAFRIFFLSATLEDGDCDAYSREIWDMARELCNKWQFSVSAAFEQAIIGVIKNVSNAPDLDQLRAKAVVLAEWRIAGKVCDFTEAFEERRAELHSGAYPSPQKIEGSRPASFSLCDKFF